MLASGLAMAVFGLLFGLSDAPAAIVIFGFLYTVISNVFSNSFHIYQAEIFPTRLRATASGSTYALSRLSNALLPFILLPVLDRVRARRDVRGRVRRPWSSWRSTSGCSDHAAPGATWSRSTPPTPVAPPRPSRPQAAPPAVRSLKHAAADRFLGRGDRPELGDVSCGRSRYSRRARPRRPRAVGERFTVRSGPSVVDGDA